MKKTKKRTASSLPLDHPGRRRLPLLLRRSWFALNQAFRRRIASSGITPDQFSLMRTLTEGPRKGMTQKDVMLAMSSDPNTIAALLARMEAAGLVERRPHESDRRAHRVRLSRKGRRGYLRLRDVAIELQAEVLSALDATERERFLAHLEIISQACAQANLRSDGNSEPR
ncbi:MAG TPA: MarR family transcriptional regulator [Planctomycetota bacterium]|nr:MarR family transcriptional regulator [Planctomycetota bacterium]